MRLSEAMRLGAMLTPQGFNGWIDGETRCALAAAADACGSIPEERSYDRTGATRLCVNSLALRQRFPIMNATAVYPCECHLGFTADVGIAITHLNDRHHWTREQIADWVETIERAQDPTLADGNQVASEVSVATVGAQR